MRLLALKNKIGIIHIFQVSLYLESAVLLRCDHFPLLIQHFRFSYYCWGRCIAVILRSNILFIYGIILQILRMISKQTWV